MWNTYVLTQTKLHPTTSQFTYIVKIPKATNIVQVASWSKKKQHFKNASKPKFSNMINHTMPQNFKNDNISPWNFQKNMQQHFSKQRNQRKTHLGIYMTIWSMGYRVLKKSIIIMPLKYWIIYLTMKSKKRRFLGGRSHFDAKKMGFGKWVSPKMGVWLKCSKHKDLKKY